MQLRVQVRDTTWPVLGSVDEKEGSPHLNPFYCKERITFRISTPELVIKSFSDAPSQPPPQSQSSPPLAPSLWGSLAQGLQRSISIVEFAPPPPAATAVGASAVLHRPLLPNSGEVGNSMFFPPKAMEGTAEWNASTPSGATGNSETGSTQDSSSNSQHPVQLVEPPDFEWVAYFKRCLPMLWSNSDLTIITPKAKVC